MTDLIDSNSPFFIYRILSLENSKFRFIQDQLDSNTQRYCWPNIVAKLERVGWS